MQTARMSNRSLFRFFASANRIQKASRLGQWKLNASKRLNYSVFRSFARKFAANLQLFKPIKLPLVVLMAVSAQEADLLKQVDELYDQNKFDEVEKLLNSPDLLEKSDKRFEFKWRLARARYGQVKEKQRNESELDAIRDLVLSALADNPECGPAHKWAAILIDEAAAKKGTKERIKQLLTVKEHMQNAIKHSPTDPTSLYLLAEWHYSCYNVSWAERQVAKVIFGTLPEPDLEEALREDQDKEWPRNPLLSPVKSDAHCSLASHLDCLKKAEELEPGFYSKNLVLLAKTLIALKKENELAKESLKKVLTVFGESTKWDDVEATKEAKALLNKLGEKV